MGLDELGTLLRNSGSAAGRSYPSIVPARVRLQRRIPPLLLGRTNIPAGCQTGFGEVECSPARVPGGRAYLRADLQRIRRQPGFDAHAPCRLARSLYRSDALGLLPATARRPRRLLVSLVDDQRGRMARDVPVVDALRKRL